MHISKIELENIKSHAASTIDFSRGTTAITGENGAGKTTIIEAIAWAMFDHLEYKKDEFIKRGAKKGSVRVTFESGLDEREYIIYRDSGAGYHVTDHRLQTRIADKKEEVFRFLWQHLGLEPGTDLKSLFKQAIGVPQGTFTAIFLEGSTERKVAFDRLLKVEEYRQAAEKLRDTSRLVDSQIGSIREGIARAEGELSRSEVVENEHRGVSEQLVKLNLDNKQTYAELAGRQARMTQLDEQERRLSDLKSALDSSRSSREKAEIILKPAEKALERSAEAAAIIETVRADHGRHVTTLAGQAELERERQQRDGLKAEAAKTEAAIVNVKAEQRRLDQEIKNIADARGEIDALRPKAAEQAAVETELDGLRNRIALAKVADERVRSIEREIDAKRQIYRTNKDDFGEAKPASSVSKSVSELEEQDRELVGNLAKLRANLERDEKFRSGVRDGLCPILSQKCLNLKPGETLESFLSNQFLDLKAQIAELEKYHGSITAELNVARDKQKHFDSREGYQKLKEQLVKDADELKAKMASLEQDRQHLGEFERRFAELESRLKALADPAARIRVLEKSLLRENEIRAGLSDVESNLERLESDRKLTAEQLDEFKALDEQWVRLTHDRTLLLQPPIVVVAEHRVAVAVGVLLEIFDVQELHRHALAAQLGVQIGRIGILTAPAPRPPRLAVQLRLERQVIERADRSPIVELARLRAADRVADAARADA